MELECLIRLGGGIPGQGGGGWEVRKGLFTNKGKLVKTQGEENLIIDLCGSSLLGNLRLF